MRKISFLMILVSVAVFAGCKDTDDELAPFVPWNAERNDTASANLTSRAFTFDETTEFANPERGMYIMVEPGLTDAISESELNRTHSKAYSLVHTQYYLHRSGDLTTDEIAKIGRDFNAIRNRGLKAIVRFSYTNNINGEDAPLSVILRHMEQLAPVIQENADIIACVQAGFIGAWGEWYYSTNGLANEAAYKQVLDKWLEILPESRTVQVRTPQYKRDYVGSTEALTADQAYQNTAKARIGHHNDAFMANESDMGTYDNPTVDKNYISQDGLYVPVGGETARESDSDTPAKGSDAVDACRSLRWSFLHDGYDQTVLDSWEADGVMPTIRTHLGYRIGLSDIDYTARTTTTGLAKFNITLRNQGWAAMYNYRPAYIVLRSADGTVYPQQLDIDLRTLKPGQTSTVSAVLDVQTLGLATGTYELLLWFPDDAEALRQRPDYSVRLANNGVWEESTGYNNTGITIEVVNE